jgi:hypothetical protein
MQWVAMPVKQRSAAFSLHPVRADTNHMES